MEFSETNQSGVVVVSGILDAFGDEEKSITRLEATTETTEGSGIAKDTHTTRKNKLIRFVKLSEGSLDIKVLRVVRLGDNHKRPGMGIEGGAGANRNGDIRDRNRLVSRVDTLRSRVEGTTMFVDIDANILITLTIRARGPTNTTRH